MRQPKGANLQSVKWQNRAVVLETLWRHQPIARKDLAARTQLTAATLTNIIAEFVDTGIVHEIGPGEPGRGRRPTLLTFVADSAYVVGLNLSRTDISVGVFDIGLDCHHLITRPATIATSSSLAETLIDLVHLAIDQSQIDPDRIAGIGISAMGPLSAKDGIIFSPPTFSQWSNVPLGTLMSDTFDRPVWLENDANADALAEHWLGAGKPYNNFIYVESHSGLGAGIILNGRLFTGSNGIAGELGHTSIDRNGPRCDCGNFGCVELYSSGPAIIRRVREEFKAGKPTQLTLCAGNDLERLTFDQIIQAAQDSDPLAVDVIQEASHALGLGLVNAVNLIDPEAVIIGHRLNRTGDICLAPIREVIQAQAFPQAATNLIILAGDLTESVGVTGAACCALNGVFQQPYIWLETTPT